MYLNSVVILNHVLLSLAILLAFLTKKRKSPVWEQVILTACQPNP
jgi:hypothetical protein